MVASPTVRTRLENGADAVAQAELEQICRGNVQIRALIGLNRRARKVPMTVTLCAPNRPDPCYGYGHHATCPEEQLGNIRSQPRNIIRWHLRTEGGISWIEGYRV